MTILIIEDDDGVRECLVSEIEFSDAYAVSAVNGAEAMTYLRNHPPPSVILLDLMMPVMDGMEFRAKQLEDPELAHIPVIVCSAVNWTPEQKEKLKAVEFLRKPFNLVDFENALQKARALLPTAGVTAKYVKPELGE